MQVSVAPDAEARLKRVVKRIYDLPSFPIVIQKLQEVAEDPNSTAKKMADVMEKDQGLSAKVLKLVNSAFYSFSKPVSSLQHAITLLGYNSIRSLAMSVSVRGLLKVDESKFDTKKFWEHALAVATATKLLAEHNKFAMKDDAFTAGLMHDCGLLLEVKYFSEELEQIGDAVASGESLRDAETRVLGVDHGLLGAWLCEQWRLPPLIAEPMLRHHSHELGPLDDEIAAELEPEIIQLLDYVTVSNLLTRALGLGHSLGPEVDKPEDASGFTIELPDHLKPVLEGVDSGKLAVAFLDQFEKAREFLTV